MAFVERSTHRLHHRVDGDSGPWLVLSNSLGTDLTMWDAQAAVLAREFRVLRYDTRGHGRSTAPPSPFSLADLGADVLALLDALDVDRACFCGLSIGGLTGQWLGVHAADRFERIVIAASAAKIGTADGWRERIAQVRDAGLAPLVAATAERWFGAAFRAGHDDEVRRVLAALATTSVDAYVGCCEALAEADLRPYLCRIVPPVLAIAGDDDAVTPPAALRFIAEHVVDGHAVVLPGRHLVNIESASAFTAAVRAFLQR